MIGENDDIREEERESTAAFFESILIKKTQKLIEAIFSADKVRW